MSKVFPWSLDDNIKDREDLIRYMEAVLEEYNASSSSKYDTPQKAFAYFIQACNECARIAKKKLWVD